MSKTLHHARLTAEVSASYAQSTILPQMPPFFQQERAQQRFSLHWPCLGSVWLRQVALASSFLVAAALFAVAGRPQSIELRPATTEDHLSDKGWWPTRRALATDVFVGDSACAKCHAPLVSGQVGSAMLRAASRRAGTLESGGPVPGTFQSGSYFYTFLHADSGYVLEVKSGGDSLRSDVQWTFGAGNHGQTYLLEEEGAFYEAQVSSFATHSLGLTPGHADVSEGSLQHALGNRLSSLETARCFSCHTTAWSTGGKLDTTKAVPGVHCEACHGPGVRHITAMQEGRSGDATPTIFNPAHLNPAASVDFCGACHRTSMDIVLSGVPNGVSGIRFQPYRLEKSRCWNKAQDARLTCVACHDPHEPLVHDTAFYDAKCLSCHSRQDPLRQGVAFSKSPGKAFVCPKAKASCTTCHMPKYNVPEMHSQFTDHFIRIVRTENAFPR